MRRRLGLIVNPVAGMGGAVGLKGTDSEEIVRLARARGAVPLAPRRAAEALAVLAASLGDRLLVIAAPGDMGEAAALAAGLAVETTGPPAAGETTAADTGAAARIMRQSGVELILFAGGDGTARNLAAAVGEEVAVVGIPAGVKMHSAAYATSPRAAGELAVRFLEARLPVRPAEVMDVDETAFRRGEVAAQLFGYLSVPHDRALVQGMKVGRVNSDEAALDSLAAEVIDRLEPGRLYVLGPGSTTRAIARRLGLDKTLLGVDVLCDGRLVAIDADEATLLGLLDGRQATVIVSPIGGQGHILGRGNQQISPAVLRRAGSASLLVVATPQKLDSLEGRPLRVDSGDAALDGMLSGYARVVTGWRNESVCRIAG
jgi:predicted polyphosphate/ATP-dependent NAD kinase